MFSCKFGEISKDTFFTEHLQVTAFGISNELNEENNATANSREYLYFNNACTEFYIIIILYCKKMVLSETSIYLRWNCIPVIMLQLFTIYPAKALRNSNQIKGMAITIKLLLYIQNFGSFTLKVTSATKR